MFLFGAGISIPIGIPAMKGIYRSFMDKKQSGISDTDKKISQYFVKNVGVEEDLEEILLAANSIIEFKDSKIKNFIDKNISPIQRAKKIKNYNFKLQKRIEEVVILKNKILSFLSDVCFQFDRDDAKKINSGFIKTISPLGYQVFTTNYDYALEYVSEEEGISVSDNFNKRGQRYLWNEKISFDGDGFKLIKLHGSVTWYADNNGMIEKIYSSTKFNPVGDEVEKIVIIPTRFKDIYDQHFFALYSHFLSSLNKADLLVIAGHSLRDDYLRAGIIERKRKGNFKIIVIDPHYPLEIKKELPHCRIGTVGDTIHIQHKWEDFSDEFSSILQNSNLENIIKDCVNILNKKKFTKKKVKIKGTIGILIAGEKKKFSVQTSAYLSSNEKPVKLRAWLRATITDSIGKEKQENSNSFIETKEIIIGDGLSGLIDNTYDVEIKIPRIPEWIENGFKVELVVALVKLYVSKASNIASWSIIAHDSKLLEYAAK